MTKLKQAFCIFFLMCMFQSLGQSFRVISGKIIGNKNNLYLSVREGFTPLKLKNNTFKIRLPKEDFPDYVSLATISGTKVKHLFPKIWIEKDSVNIVFNINGTDKKYQIDKKTSYQDISEKIENASSKQERKELIKQNINMTVIMSTHDVYCAKRLSNKIIEIKGGEIINIAKKNNNDIKNSYL